MSQQFEEIRGLELPKLEESILHWWQTNDTFRAGLRARAGQPTFTFYEGPPTANGLPGIHHVLGRTIKDVFCRYQSLKGKLVERKGGWDTHGLPVEIQVEKELNLESREQIEEYGIAKYNAACRASVLRYKQTWDELTERIGYWVDLDDPYVTFETPYIESVWWLVKQLHEKNLLYRGHKIQWYSPGSGTVLSSHEVSLGYAEVNDPSVYIRFRSVADPNISYLAWTTTPWTLVSNAALAVGTNIDYVKVRVAVEGAHDEYLILAKARLEVLKQEVEIVETLRGADLLGARYEPLYRLDSDPQTEGYEWRIVAADYVTTEDGTGIVHTAPAFGADDYATGQKEGLAVFNPIGLEGCFDQSLALVAGLWFKDADKKIARDLRERGLLFRHDTYLHNYPLDWRKGTPLMSYPVDSWFIRTTALKDKLVALNQSINWYPPAIRDGRFGNWLENNVDWALSRRRYWGTPLPVWVSDAPDSEYFEVIGSIAELREKCGEALPPDEELDLHRPFVDELTWPAPDGGTMRRVPYVMDVWFDSGAMPFAQWHYPFENKEVFDRAFPADFICEGLDQTRGWFYTLHAIATLVTGTTAFRNVVVNGLILDEKGEKMSKAKGNTVDPFGVVATYGADVVRWYMMSNSPPWDSMKFSERGLGETRRKFFGTLENVYSFMASYANIDGFAFEQARIPVAERSELDRWVCSRLNSTIAEVDAAFTNYDATKAARALERLVDDLSNWYIRRSRRRFWKAKQVRDGAVVSDYDKDCAYQTTYECLVAIVKMMSPIAPFMSEWMYRALNKTTGLEHWDSVHHTNFPAVETGASDLDLEARMAIARHIVTAVLLLRNKAGINVRQPLSRLLIVTGPGVDEATVEQVRDIICDEVNVRAIEYIANSSTIVTRSAKPNFPALGPRLGKNMGAAGKIIQSLDDEAINAYLSDGQLSIEVGQQAVLLGPDDLEIVSEEVGGWLVTQENGITVALDIELTEDLIQQGLAREVVNRIQNMRKKAEFELADRIRVEFVASSKLALAIQTHVDWIKSETLATELVVTSEPGGESLESFEIEGETLTIGISRIVS